jgi:hypothetical protein
MYFRLMAAMFGIPVTPMSEIIQLRPITLLHLKIIGDRRKFGYITFELYHIPFTYGVIATNLNFCGRGSNVAILKISERNVLVIPYRLVKTA